MDYEKLKKLQNTPWSLHVNIDLFDLDQPDQDAADALRSLAAQIEATGLQNRVVIERSPLSVEDAEQKTIGAAWVKWYMD